MLLHIYIISLISYKMVNLVLAFNLNSHVTSTGKLELLDNVIIHIGKSALLFIQRRSVTVLVGFIQNYAYSYKVRRQTLYLFEE